MLLFEMLSGRHPRWRCNSLAHRLLSPPDPRTSAACQCPLLLLCFQQLPTIKVCNPFILITMQIARGVGGTRPTAHLKKNLNCCRLGNSSLATPHSPVSPLECAVTKMRPRKSFRMRSYKKDGGRGTLKPVRFKSSRIPFKSCLFWNSPLATRK